MKIENSNVSMVSSRRYSEYTYKQTSSSLRVLNQKEDSLGFFRNYLNQPTKLSKAGESKPVDNSYMSLRLLLLRRIFDSIAGRGKLDNRDMNKIQSESLLDLRSDENTSETSLSSGTVWQRINTTTSFYCEHEAVTFGSTGYATTADGRTISFDVELSMTRSFTAAYESYESVDYIVTDPLMIDLGNSGASVTDVKYLFDLDADGVAEEISFASSGNGFLALDLNEDGIINDGSELFGAKTGDGFSELSKYDSDGNGWIDENDDIFSKLRVWTKDEQGNDELIDLLSADVGAIYLGHAPTDFALTNESGYANAFMRSTGIYLHESGSVGSISQLDLTS